VLDRDGLVYTKIELATIGSQSPIWWDTGLAREDLKVDTAKVAGR
jgi:hypothetical protein